MGRAATGSTRKLDSKRWQARFTYPNGKRVSKTFQTKALADGWLRGQTTDVERGIWQPDQDTASVSISFEDYAERTIRERSLKPRTRAGYRDLLDRFILPEFGTKPVHLIGRDDVKRWYYRTAVDRPTYRAKAYGLLRSIMNSAVEDRVVAVNPVHIRRADKIERRHVVRPATIDELDTLTAAIPPRYQLLVQLAAWCALRFGEVTELRRSDVDTKEGVLRIRRAVSLVDGKFVVDTPKTAAGIRDVAIPPHLLPLVRQHLLEHAAPGPDGLLFPARNNPAEHLRQTSMYRVYERARQKAGRPDLRFHDLRHTGAVNAGIVGATLEELKGRLGHSTASAAMLYQHIAAGRDSLIAARLSALYEADHKQA